MDYGFNLEWQELPEDFRNEKIDEVLRKQWQEKEDAEERDFENYQDVEEYIEDQAVRDNIEKWIESHFPIYF